MWEGVQSFHALSGHTTLPAPPHVHQPGHVWVSMEASSHRHGWLLTPFTTLFSSQENGGKGEDENFNLLIIAWSFRWPALIQEPTQSCLIRTKDNLTTQEITRVSGALCQEPGSETKYWNKRCSYCSYHLRIYKGFRISVPGTRDRYEYICISYYKSQYHRHDSWNFHH